MVSTPNFSTWLFSLQSRWGEVGQLHSSPSGQIFEFSKDEYLIVADGMVLSVCKDTFECVTLEHWEKECNILRRISRIPFFAHFKKWKPFYVWRAKVRSKKFNMARMSLQERLFIVNEVCDCLICLKFLSVLTMYQNIYSI